MTAPDRRLSRAEAAAMCGCDAAALARLAMLGLTPENGLQRADINGIRLMLSLEQAGIDLAAFADAIAAGTLSAAFSRSLLPEPLPLSAGQPRDVLSELGLDHGLASRLFIAAGLPPPDDGRPLREDDVALLRLIAQAIAFGGSEDAIARALRVFGSATRRIAGALRDFFHSEVEDRLASTAPSPAALMTASAQRRVPLQMIGAQVLQLMYTRFLEDAVFENVTTRIHETMAAAGYLPPRQPADPAVLFVDIADFSRLTRESGDLAAAALALAFESTAQTVVAGHGGQVVKALGDGLLILFDDATRAVDGCLALIAALAAAGLPPVHAGLAVGSVIRRDGDIFGNTVNLAARLAAYAEPSQIAADTTTVALLGTDRHRWTDAGRVAPKGMAEAQIFTLCTGAVTGS